MYVLYACVCLTLWTHKFCVGVFTFHALIFTYSFMLYIYYMGHIYIWVILLKTGQNCDTEGKNSKCEFLMLLFGNESLTSLVYINIRHINWQGDRNLVNCALCYIIGQCLTCYRRHQKCKNRVSSVASLTLAFFIIQYFLINKGISVTSDI